MIAAKTRRRLLAWGVTTIVAALYIGAARIEAHSVGTKLTLTPGNEIEIDVFRVQSENLHMVMEFSRKPGDMRPELGTWQGSTVKDGFEIATPGANARLEVSGRDQGPVTFEARPANGYGAQSISRFLSTSLAVRPGVYRHRWSPDLAIPVFHLHFGMNKLRLKVTLVEPPIVGETVELYVLAPLGFLSYQQDVGWLWPGILLEWIMWVTQPIWLLVILVQNRKAQATSAANAPLGSDD